MPRPRKGTATVKKVDKYVHYSGSAGDDEEGDAANASPVRLSREECGEEKAEPEAARERRKLSNEAQHERKDGAGQPRQDSATVDEQGAAPAQALFPTDPPPSRPPARSRKHKTATDTPAREEKTPGMVQGGAHIPPNQHRHMRACMVCSIVRTQQQFTTYGCPNCEDILELIGNPEQVNDCTSQVFEGLISVADTNRSWVARYQRLEGYVPGVYATQVEGILPEDVLVAVESAGINYVPRDGSEQEMLGKD